MDKPKALGLFEEAARLGSRVSMYRLGVACEFGELGVEVDEPKALRLYTDAAALGYTYTKEVQRGGG